LGHLPWHATAEAIAKPRPANKIIPGIVCMERLDRSPARLAFRFSPSVIVSIGWYGVVA
jgi:hypothetical protein